MKNYLKFVAGAVLAVSSVSAFAVGPDFSTLTAAVDFSTVGTAVLAIAALLALPLVIKKGAKMVLSAIK
ncbi:hypothetical protein [Methylobacter sp. S3L5C]|uniref:hypothetical protein n=1 Tax=Methylobacter sp. S3L5C TaxID=2839024 RepID=UPI001FAC24D0|nr:hypothetical protein [Methylobacter sp. S3L5C]